MIVFIFSFMLDFFVFPAFSRYRVGSSRCPPLFVASILTLGKGVQWKDVCNGTTSDHRAVPTLCSEHPYAR